MGCCLFLLPAFGMSGLVLWLASWPMYLFSIIVNIMGVVTIYYMTPQQDKQHQLAPWATMQLVVPMVPAIAKKEATVMAELPVMVTMIAPDKGEYHLD